jgi:hypothetical protein
MDIIKTTVPRRRLHISVVITLVTSLLSFTPQPLALATIPEPIYEFLATGYEPTTGVWTRTGSVKGSLTRTAKDGVLGFPLKNSTPNSVEFNGPTTGYQFINDVPETNGIDQAYSISSWIKTTTAGRKILGFEGHRDRELSGGYDKNLFIDAAGKLVFASSSGDKIISTATVTDNQWHHAVATYGGLSRGIKLYLNGALIGTKGTATAVQKTGYWRIGGYMMDGWGISSGYYSGSIGEVSIYNSAISQSVVEEIYANTKSTYEGLTPTFGTPTATADGFTVQISNYDALYTWAGTATTSGSVSISNTGLVTVTGVAPSTSSTATITSSRAGYSNRSATVTATSTTGVLTPTFGSPTATADGFTVSITNYDAAFTWATPTVSAGTVAITSTTGATRVLTVTGLSPGASATITQNTSRTNYSNGTATVSGSATAAAQSTAADNSAAQAEAARRAREQQELIDILALIPKIGELTLSLGETTKSLYSTKCVKGKTTKFVKKGSKCPKGYKKK